MVEWRAPRGRMQGAVTKAMQDASGRSGNAADGPAPPQPLAAAGFSLAAREVKRNNMIRMLSCGARCEKPDATPASISQQPASRLRETGAERVTIARLFTRRES